MIAATRWNGEVVWFAAANTIITECTARDEVIRTKDNEEAGKGARHIGLSLQFAVLSTTEKRTAQSTTC